MTPDKAPLPGGTLAHAKAPAGTQAEPLDIRPLMASFPTGVVVVTTVDEDGQPWGMTCTSLCSVSLDPPTLLVCLRCGSPTLRAVLASDSFAVNLLHDQARSAAELFASGVPDRFDRITWHAGTRGPHLVGSAHTIADCAVVNAAVVGTHTVVMGRVERVVQLRAQRPLLYGLRRYASWPEDITGYHLSSDIWAALGY
jgi:flavin reductase (NADH)